MEKVTCHCERHQQGCGCLSQAFIERARNSFSSALMEAQSAEEFARKMKSPARHARDQHEWEGSATSILHECAVVESARKERS